MVKQMNFNETLLTKTNETEELVKKYLPKEEGFQKTVIEAMNYSFLAGGKRLRPLIMSETYKAFGGNETIIEPFMAALEMIHNYSLVHDDLPEMDNDELRRGMPTTHVKYGAGMAVLAGDGLLNYAFETVAKAFDMDADMSHYKAIAEAFKVLSKKAGIYGMIGGQTLDVEAEEKELSLDEAGIEFINENKTAALLEAALMIGGILAGVSEETVNKLEKIGSCVGIAFQLQDDILDITSTTEVLGKPVGSDERNNKRTYIALHGIEKATAKQKELSAEAVRLFDEITDGAKNEESCNFLKELIISLVERKK